jgi:hypothetical protein
LLHKTNTVSKEVEAFLNSIEGKRLIDERLSKQLLQDSQALRQPDADPLLIINQPGGGRDA